MDSGGCRATSSASGASLPRSRPAKERRDDVVVVLEGLPYEAGGAGAGVLGEPFGALRGFEPLLAAARVRDGRARVPLVEARVRLRVADGIARRVLALVRGLERLGAG